MSSHIVKKRIHVITRNKIINEREFFLGMYPWRKWQIVLYEAEDGQLDGNMSFVSKVVFRLHEDFEKPNRIVTQPPFKVEEEGWGGFEVPITLFFKHPNARPFTFVHDLRFDHEIYESAIDLEYEDILDTDTYETDLSGREPSRIGRKTIKAAKEAALERQHRLDRLQKKLVDLPDETLDQVIKLLDRDYEDEDDDEGKQ